VLTFFIVSAVSLSTIRFAQFLTCLPVRCPACRVRALRLKNQHYRDPSDTTVLSIRWFEYQCSACGERFAKVKVGYPYVPMAMWEAGTRSLPAARVL